MNPEEKEILKGKIENKMEGLREEISLLQEQTQPIIPDNTLSGDARMDAVNAKSMNEEALYAAHMKLLKLENTLKNIEMPFFGICTSCQGPIPFKRILALPEGLVCIDCVEED